MTLHLVHNAEGEHGGEDARRTLAEVSAVAEKLRTFLETCRKEPSLMASLTAADIAQAKAVLAVARARLARARRSIS